MGIENDIKPKKNLGFKHYPKRSLKPQYSRPKASTIDRSAPGEDQSLTENQNKDNSYSTKPDRPSNTKKTVYNPKKTNKKNPVTKWVIILLMILIGLIIWQNYDSISSYFNISSHSETNNESDYYYSTNSQDYTDTNSASIDDDTGDNGDASTDSTVDSSETTAQPNTSFRTTANVEVLNGNGISGSAKSVKDTLNAQGYSVAHVANALKFTYLTTEIYYQTGQEQVASDIQSILSDRSCQLFLNNTIAKNYHVVVVVGKT